MTKQPVRLRDIATRTGFSANTVSLALRESPRIGEATREIIREAAKELNYVPNNVARSLVSRRTMTIGLLLTDISNPLLTRVAQEVGRTLSKRGYATLFATSDNQISNEREAIETFRARQVEGILMYPTDHRETSHMKAVRELGYPIVSLVDDPTGAIDTVSVDEQNGAQQAADHLIQSGRSRLAMLDAATPLGNTEKWSGFKDAHANAGIAVRKTSHVELDGHEMESGYRGMAELMGRRLKVDGVLATNDSVAIGALRWCNENGLKVPEDIAIAGFDDIEFARFASITSVSFPIAEQAATAVDHLTDLVTASEGLPAPRAIRLQPSLVLRGSTAAV